VPALIKAGTPLRVQSSGLNEWIIKELGSHKDYVDGWGQLMSKAGSSETCIVVDDPSTKIGNRNFERARLDYSECNRFVALAVCENGSPPSNWAQCIASFDEIWVLSEPERQFVIKTGISPSKVQLVPLGIDTENFTPAIDENAGNLVDGRFCFLANIHSTDDPLFRQPRI
jgi:hypothetical protein